jgi:hypothetical protein
MRISQWVLCCAFSLLTLGQTPEAGAVPKPARMKLNVLEMRPPKAPEPAPGEFVEIDRDADWPA